MRRTKAKAMMIECTWGVRRCMFGTLNAPCLSWSLLSLCVPSHLDPPNMHGCGEDFLFKINDVFIVM